MFLCSISIIILHKLKFSCTFHEVKKRPNLGIVKSNLDFLGSKLGPPNDDTTQYIIHTSKPYCPKGRYYFNESKFYSFNRGNSKTAMLLPS